MKTKFIQGDKYRITVLTDRMIRVEYQEQGHFEDRKTTGVVNREFPECDYSLERNEEGIVVETSQLLLRYNEAEPSTQGLSILVKSTGNTWNYGMGHANTDGNLHGTARTLDLADGPIFLEDGIFGTKGFAALDDSKSAVCHEDGEYRTREYQVTDVYFFGFGTDYYGGLKEFYRLCGKTPLIPRYALGNWWSRFYKYTEDSYLELMDKFEEEKIPLSVAVIDMDWHVTAVDPKYGTGWTGYSWNKEYFPDYKRFLKKLHERGLSTTVNLHPADGIRAFEDMYTEVATKMGIDPATEEPVKFDFGDTKFRDTYFEEVMHPYEKDGVDFWWIDWQQGTGLKETDVDPLFLLNHYHYHDQENRNVRPMIFSRYAGPGSHRYPVGFSGDTKATWRSLDFQPYFTSTASNIGYGWWSHDIGGHMLGDRNDERLLRWVQFGVFSPVMRLHSSSSAFMNKEPWVLSEPYHGIIAEFMRLRHRLIPYLYTENYRAYMEDRPLIRPMYYLLPGDERAYNVPCEYGFGENLIVGAITTPEDSELKQAAVNMVIPDGRWMDILNGRIYRGGQKRKLYRKINEIPVLLKAGGILPLSMEDTQNGTANPEALRLCVGSGADGSYTLYEDDGITMEYRDGKFVETKYEVSYKKAASESDEIRFTVQAAEGDLSLIPEKRDYEIRFYGVEKSGEEISVKVQGVGASETETGLTETMYDEKRRILTIKVADVITEKGCEVFVGGIREAENDYRQQVFDILENCWMETEKKDIIYNAMMNKNRDDFRTWIKESEVSELLKDAFEEVM